MDNEEKRLRRWFQRHGWHTESGAGYAHVWLERKSDGLLVSVDPIMAPNFINGILVYPPSEDAKYADFTVDELQKLAALAKIKMNCVKELRKIQKQKSQKIQGCK